MESCCEVYEQNLAGNEPDNLPQAFNVTITPQQLAGSLLAMRLTSCGPTLTLQRTTPHSGRCWTSKSTTTC